MKHLSIILILLMAGLHSNAIGLQQAIKEKKVKITASSTGGLHMNLKVHNLTATNLDVELEPALIFKPTDTGYQDMVLLGGERLALKAHAEDSVAIKTYCGKSYAHSPAKDLHYNFAKQGNEVMVSVINFIKAHPVSESTTQFAVWAMTNDYSLTNVYDYANKDASIALASYMAHLLKRPTPEFFHNRSITLQGNTMISSTPDAAYVFIKMDVPAMRTLHIEIYHSDGGLYKVVKQYELMDAGNTAKVRISTRKTPPGDYIVRLRDDGNHIWQENRVHIEVPET